MQWILEINLDKRMLKTGTILTQSVLIVAETTILCTLYLNVVSIQAAILFIYPSLNCEKFHRTYGYNFFSHHIEWQDGHRSGTFRQLAVTTV